MASVNYKGQELTVRRGAWADEMNSWLYECIDSVSVRGYIVCREYESGELFALRGTLAVDVVPERQDQSQAYQVLDYCS